MTGKQHLETHLIPFFYLADFLLSCRIEDRELLATTELCHSLFMKICRNVENVDNKNI
jgi:hypothetical protein